VAELSLAADQPLVPISAMAGVMRQVGHPHAGFPVALIRHWLEVEVGAAEADSNFLIGLMQGYSAEPDSDEWRECVNPHCEVRGSWKQSATCGICEQPTRRRNG
jgi:hypothetical protein